MQIYGFSEENYETFLESAKQTEFFFKAFMVAGDIMLGFFCARCLLHSHTIVKDQYLWIFCVAMFVTSFLSYHCMTLGILTMFIFMVASQNFLVLLAKTHSARAHALAHKSYALNRLEEEESSFFPRTTPIGQISERALKRLAEWVYASEFKQLRDLLFAFSEEFKKINTFIERQVTARFLNTLFCGLLFPIYFFFDLEIISKVSVQKSKTSFWFEPAFSNLKTLFPRFF